MRLKKGDNVIMMNGKDRGKSGKISRVDVARSKILVEGLNLIKKHIRARQQGQKGQIISKERFVAVASVALICKVCGKPTRLGYRLTDGGKVRICKKCKGET